MSPDNHRHIGDTQTTNPTSTSTALKGTLQDKKMSWKVVPNEISITELDLDISTDRREAKLKRSSYNLRKADWEKLREELARTEPSRFSSNLKEATTEFTNWITKASDKTIPKTYIN
jgi:hypothetical protein